MKRSCSSRAHVGVVAHEIARAQQEVEEVEAAGARLRALVLRDQRPEIVAEERRELGTGAAARTARAPALPPPGAACGRRARDPDRAGTRSIASAFHVPGRAARPPGRRGRGPRAARAERRRRRSGGWRAPSGRRSRGRRSPARARSPPASASGRRWRCRGRNPHVARARGSPSTAPASTPPGAAPRADRRSRSVRHAPAAGGRAARQGPDRRAPLRTTRSKTRLKRRRATSSGATWNCGSTRASTGRSRSRSAQKAWIVPMRAASS